MPLISLASYVAAPNPYPGWEKIGVQPSQSGYGLAAGTNNQVLAAANGSGGAGSYSKDHGVTWTKPSIPSGLFITNSAISSDGQVIIFQGTSGAPYMTRDGGSTWVIPSTSGTSNGGLACSSDGKYILCSGRSSSDARMRLSSDFGVTWGTVGTIVSSNSGLACCMSKNGKYMYQAIGNSNAVRFSSDFGATWSNLINSAALQLGTTLRCSDDGSIVCGVSSAKKLCISKDFGVTWSTNSFTFAAAPQFLDLSGDGSTYAIGGNGFFAMSVDSGVSIVVMDQTPLTLSGIVRAGAFNYDGSEFITSMPSAKPGTWVYRK